MSIYVFGYGSLINKNELSEELNKTKKVTPVIVKGLKRSFIVSSNGSKYKVLGVKESKQASCNGVLFKVTEKELKNLIKRETNYSIKAIDKDRLYFPYGKTVALKKEDTVLCFYPDPLFKLTKTQSERIPIKPNYLNICLEGAKALGEDFMRDFTENTPEMQIHFL